MITFKIVKDGEEFHTWAPELPGCHSHGTTVNEAMKNLKEAIELYLDVIMEEELTLQSLELT